MPRSAPTLSPSTPPSSACTATSYWRTGAVFRTALGAVEAAMLDIKGKALGVPVFELLGGKYRDRVACYANHWFWGARTPEEYAEEAARWRWATAR